MRLFVLLLVLCPLASAQTYPAYDPYYGLAGQACGTLYGPGQAPVSTACSSGCTVSPGVATITPLSMANIEIGQPLLYDRTGTYEYVVPTAVTGSRWDGYESLGADQCGGCGWFTMNDNQFDGIQDVTNPTTDTIGSQTFVLIPELAWPGGNGNSLTPVQNAILGIERTLAGVSGSTISGTTATSGPVVVQ